MEGLLPSVPALLVLVALADRPMHAYEVGKWVRERSGSVLALPEGTLYPLLHQLAREGCLASWEDDSPSGRKVTRYALRQAGWTRLDALAAAWEERAGAVGRLVADREKPRP